MPCTTQAATNTLSYFTILSGVQSESDSDSNGAISGLEHANDQEQFGEISEAPTETQKSQQVHTTHLNVADYL